MKTSPENKNQKVLYNSQQYDEKQKNSARLFKYSGKNEGADDKREDYGNPTPASQRQRREGRTDTYIPLLISFYTKNS